MTWPSGDVDTTGMDSGSDTPPRATFLSWAQKFNLLINHFTSFMQGLMTSANAAAARETLDVPSRGGGNATGDWPINAVNVTGTVAVGNGGTGQTTAPGIQSILPINQARTSIASAATLNLTTGAAGTDHVNITGTTTITAVTVAAGRVIFVRFGGVLTLTSNANINTNSGGNIITAAGDTCILRATSANAVEVISYVPSRLNAQGGSSMVRVQISNGYGSTNLRIRRWSSVTTSQGSDITYADSASLGGSFTINTAGVYAISYVESFNAAGRFGITVSAADPTATLGGTSIAERLAVSNTAVATAEYCAATTVSLPAGAIIRAHTDGGVTGDANRAMFTVSRVG